MPSGFMPDGIAHGGSVPGDRFVGWGEVSIVS